MKLWLISYLLLNAFELYNQTKCDDLTKELDSILTDELFETFCSLGQAAEGRQCKLAMKYGLF